MRESLSLQHQTLISQACHELQLPFSEYNFSTLYLFRNKHQYEILSFDNSRYVIFGRSYQGEPFLLPLFIPEDWSELIDFGREQKVSYIFPVHESYFEQFGEYSIDVREEESDYLYKREAIERYKGRHYDGHRNAIRHLLTEHRVEITAFGRDQRDEASFVVEQWRKDHAQADAEECLEAIEKFELLGISGVMLYIDGLPSGILLGEMLTKEIYLNHFIKGIQKYRGIYQYLYQQGAKMAPSCVHMLNWEQDLGISFLRAAKKMYHPISLLHKGRVMIA